MLFSAQQLNELSKLLDEQGLKYKDEKLIEVGILIIKFVYAREVARMTDNNDSK